MHLMKWTRKVTMPVAFSLLAMAAAPASPGLAQDKQPAAAPATAGEMDEMMKTMSPGPQHKLLAQRVGDWTYTNKMWMAPGQPPMESSGTMHGEMILGGRYLEMSVHGQMMGMPFEGRSTEGYDNLAKQYVGTWVDNFGTGIMNGPSVCDEAARKCTWTADTMDPMSGKKVTTRQVTTLTDADHFTMEMYAPGPSGKEMKQMEIQVKRK
jgi:hypothetical protein